MVEDAFSVLAHLRDHAVELASNPPNRAPLLRINGSPICDVIMREEFLCLLKPDPSLRIRAEKLALSGLKLDPYVYHLGYLASNDYRPGRSHG